jgi:hypothetical protein
MTLVNKDHTTLADLQEAFPSRKNSITQEVVDAINESANDPEFQATSLLKDAITYEAVLQRNKVGVLEYVNALKFCAFMISLEDNYTEAYKRVFNDREFVKERANQPTHSTKYKELTSAASRYRRSKVVVDILTVSQAPLELLFGGARMQAVGVLADMMMSAKYDKDRISAAKELLVATKGADNMKIELDVGVKGNSMQEMLHKQLSELASNQKALLERGVSIGSVQKLGITTGVIEGELE